MLFFFCLYLGFSIKCVVLNFYMIFSDWGVNLMDSICDGHVDCNDLLSSITGSSTLSLLACVHICVWTWLYICTVFTHSLWYVCWNRSFSNFLFKQKCQVICLVPIYQIYTQVWKLKRNGIMEMKKEELGSPLFGASGNFAWLLKAIPKELY